MHFNNQHKLSRSTLARVLAFAGLVTFTATANVAHAQKYPVTPQQKQVARATAASGVPISALAPNAPNEYVVKRGDTLSKIASATKPEGVSLEQMLVLLEKQSPELPEGYRKVWRSYCSVRDAALADNDTKELIHRRVLELQQKKKLTNYRLYTDLKLNPGNVNAWLKHNDSSKMSLDCARQIYKYAKSYPSVR